MIIPKEDYFWLLAVICFIFVAAFLLINLAFGFNYTQELKNEERILILCTELDAYIANCWDMIGSLDKSYGEPLR